jgi:hypothetical protein
MLLNVVRETVVSHGTCAPSGAADATSATKTVARQRVVSRARGLGLHAEVRRNMVVSAARKGGTLA